MSEQEAKSALQPGQRSALVWLWLAIIVAVIDLAVKHLASTELTYGMPVRVFSFLDWTLLHNTGAAFSFLAEAGGWQRWFFVAVAVVVSGVLLVWLKRTPRQFWWLGMALALILGGAVGNLYDRAVHGYVVDYISVHYGGYYFPAFNLADSAITAGAIILIVDMLFLSGGGEKLPQENEETQESK